MPTIKVAAIQHAPVFLDLEASTAKACSLIAEAKKQGAQLVVFPETFLPAYPCWVWKVAAGETKLLEPLYAKLLAESVTIGDETTTKLCRAARDAGVLVVMGINERDPEFSNATIYNTLLYINDEGEVIGKHRKLVPTGGERLVWGRGDGSTLDVFDVAIGRLGGLICWENYMPLARYTMYAGGTQLYVAPTWASSEGWLATLQHIALEGGCFVIGCCQAMRTENIPGQYEFKQRYEGEWVNGGRSAIVSPRGTVIAGPVWQEETILYADCDLEECSKLKWELDTGGHYARPDVFRLLVNREVQNLLDSSGE